MIEEGLSTKYGHVRPLAEIYEELRPTRYGTFLLGLCIMIGMVEGYDMQAMALAAPLLKQDWQLSTQAVGALLSISLVGQVFGGILLAPLGDRIGRRTAMLLGLAFTGLFTFGAAYVPDYNTMLAVRFLAGLGLGLVLTNNIALAMELVPSNWRSMSVVLVNAGYPLGAACGAAIVGQFLSTHGVATVFYVGGIGTLVALMVSLALLPESPIILVQRAGDQAGLRALFSRMGNVIPPSTRLVGDKAADGRSKVGALFTPERRTVTLLLWVLMFSNLALCYFFVMWLPSIFVSSGLQPGAAIMATSLYNFSGIVGGIVLAGLSPRFGPVATLWFCYGLTIICVGVVPGTDAPSPAFYICLVGSGFLTLGSQFCLAALANLFYPGTIRTTGVGFALGVGRIGGVLAPVTAGIVLANVSSPKMAFYIALAPAAVCFVAIMLLYRQRHVELR